MGREEENKVQRGKLECPKAALSSNKLVALKGGVLEHIQL